MIGKKKIATVILLVCVLSLYSTALLAVSSDINVELNGKVMTFDVSPQIVNGITLLPARAIMEAFGATVVWDPETKTVNIEKENKKINLFIDKPVALVNDHRVELAVGATIIENRTMVPLRFISECFGANVNWNSSIRTVQIVMEIPCEEVELELPYCDLNKPYISKDNNMTVEVTKIKTNKKEQYMEFTIEYNQKNNTTDQAIDEGTFKIFYKNGESEPQYGFFNKLYPGETITRTYTFKALKSQEPICIEYGADHFFDKNPAKDALKWEMNY